MAVITEAIVLKVVQINGGVYGSTGTIMFSIAEAVKKNNGEAICFSPVTVSNRYYQPAYLYRKVGSFRSRQICVLLERITGLSGCNAFFATCRVLKKLSEIKPDIVHLHTLHNAFINLPMLFNYLKKYNINVVWTLHDCWAFTGHCVHFDLIGCNKWKHKCNKCPQYKEYPKSFFDNSKYMYMLKKKWFNNVQKMIIVTPSNWLANLVKQSFLLNYPVRIINNGIDLEIFQPTESEFRKKYDCINKYIVLGVAFGWGEKKGLDVICQLAKRLDSRKYKMVIVGTNKAIDSILPDNVVSIHRTHAKTELAQIYTAADVFINPTREDTYPTVNMEALACGTPVVTFGTGGSSEMIGENCGSIVKRDDIDHMEKEIINICETKKYESRNCVEKAQMFDSSYQIQKYIELYKEIINE